MSKFRKLFAKNSLRKQYLILAGVLAGVIISFTAYTGNFVKQTGQSITKNIERRIDISELSHRIRHAVVKADNALDLFLLSPTNESRQRFNEEIKRARAAIMQLLASNWIASGHMLPMLQGMQPLLSSVEKAGAEIMIVRQTANLMYPAMRLANGDMLDANRQIMTSLDISADVLANKKKLNQPELQAQKLLIAVRENWHRMIKSYRLYLINRIGSLFEDAVQHQINDVELIYEVVLEKSRELARLDARYNLPLEISVAADELQELIPLWHVGLQEVLRIDADGHWRGDLPLMTDVIHPLFAELYAKLDQLDDELKQSSDNELVEQHQVGYKIISSLWGMAVFVILVVVLSLILMETNIIRPIADVARSLKAEAHGHRGQLPSVEAAEIRDLIDAFRELRQQVHSRQMALEHIALHDALTSLPNRTLLMERLEQTISLAQQRKRSMALLMLDLDRFKEINDTLGHQTGDALLQQVGVRLRTVLRDSDTVARLGGDEFAIVLPEVNESNALRIAAAVNDTLEKVYEVYEHSLYVGVSLGVAIFPLHGETSEMLLQHADVAMYMAKRSNTGICMYDIARDQHSVSQLSVLSDLRSAVEKEEFILEYQPKLCMDNSTIMGAEALIRWQHPVQGRIMPDAFISVAEQTGLIKRISNWVLDTAIRDCKRLHDEGHRLAMSVNLSVWDTQDTSLSRNIESKLKKWGLAPEYLIVEITERVMMAEPERASLVLKELDQMGLRIVIDDFGTGFSSMVYLKQLPVDMLKIDKSFVMDMMRDESDAAIVHSVIELAHNLGLEVTAEGVETDQSWSWLKTWNCDYAQGYYISTPLNLQDLKQYLGSSKKQEIFST